MGAQLPPYFPFKAEGVGLVRDPSSGPSSATDLPRTLDEALHLSRPQFLPCNITE